MAMAVLPGLGQIIGQKTKGAMPPIWKLNYGNVKINGDYACIPVYSNVRDAMKVAADNGAKFWGATFYTGSINTPEMRRQLSEMDEAGALEGLGGVVWNYPRGSELKGGDADVYNQLRGFDYITNNRMFFKTEKICNRFCGKVFLMLTFKGVFIAFSLLLLALPILSCSGGSPSNLGVSDSGLAPCPSSPNCVSSDAQDKDHYVKPLQLAVPSTEALASRQGIGIKAPPDSNCW